MKYLKLGLAFSLGLGISFSAVAIGATTIGNNISTGGNLEVTGNATTTGDLVVEGDLTIEGSCVGCGSGGVSSISVNGSTTTISGFTALGTTTITGITNQYLPHEGKYAYFYASTFGQTQPTGLDPNAGKMSHWSFGVSDPTGASDTKRGDVTYWTGYNLNETGNAQVCDTIDNHCIFDRTEVYWWDGTKPVYEHHMGYIDRNGVTHRIWNQQSELNNSNTVLSLGATAFDVYDTGNNTSYFTLSSTSASFVSQATINMKNGAYLVGQRNSSAGGSGVNLIGVQSAINTIAIGGAAATNGLYLNDPVIRGNDDDETAIAIGSDTQTVNDDTNVIKFVRAQYNVSSPQSTLRTSSPHVSISASSSEIRLGTGLFYSQDTVLRRAAANNFQFTAGAAATSTLTIGSANYSKGSCLELYDTAGNVVYAYVPAGGTAFTLSSTSCK